MTDLFQIDAPTTTTSLELRRLQRDIRRRQRRIRTLIASAIGLVVFALGASIAWNFVEALRPAADEIQDFDGFGQGQVQIIINSGDDGIAIAKTLFDNGVVASERAFILETYDNPTGALKIQPGYYVLPKEMKAEYALGMLIDPGDRKVERNITIPEGYTVAKTLEKVSSITGYSLEEVQAVAADTEALGLPLEAGGNLEGWLFPDTYRFNPDVHPADVLATMIRRTVAVLEDNDVPRENWQRVLVFASIVEREAKLDADFPLIAGVLQNRLNIDMALQCDSTLAYGLGISGLDITSSDLQSDNSYNTYTHLGLPPGPIASPGEVAIKATLQPRTDTGYFYFVTINLNTGETRYGATLQDHLANVALLRAWQAENS